MWGGHVFFFFYRPVHRRSCNGGGVEGGWRGGGRKEGSREVGENVEGISVQRQKSDGYDGYGYPAVSNRKYEWTKIKKIKGFFFFFF